MEQQSRSFSDTDARTQTNPLTNTLASVCVCVREWTGKKTPTPTWLVYEHTQHNFMRKQKLWTEIKYAQSYWQREATLIYHIKSRPPVDKLCRTQ